MILGFGLRKIRNDDGPDYIEFGDDYEQDGWDDYDSDLAYYQNKIHRALGIKSKIQAELLKDALVIYRLTRNGK